MGFLFSPARMIIIAMLHLVLGTSGVAQERPEWTNMQRNSIGQAYYYGIGVSQVSMDEADTRAFIEFARNVEVQVKSLFQHEVSEQGTEFSEATNITTQLISDISLKGIAITERFMDSAASSYFSLIQYRKTEYDSLVQFQIEREIVLMKVRNKMEEEKRQEENRMQRAMNQLAEEKKKEELRAQQEQLTLEQQEEELLRKKYGEFLAVAPPEKVVTIRNGEVSNGESSLLLRGGLTPLRFRNALYAARTGVFEAGGSVTMKERKIDRQEAYLKLQVLPRVGEFTRTSIALGAVQAIVHIADSGYQFKRSKYSLFVSGNVTIPEYYYSTVSFYGDKRLAGIGVTTFPFYDQFKTHVGFMLEMVSVFDRDFRNARGNAFMVNAGLRLQASDAFSTQLTVEEYEELILSLEFQF